ncbi:MAG: deaminase [Patescibacteria group bacterium]
MKNKSNKAVVAYVPVLHEGYYQLFKNHLDARTLYIFGDDVIGEFAHLDRDIRRISPILVKKAIEAWEIFETVEILTPEKIKDLSKDKTPLVVSDDDLTQELISKYFSKNPIEKDTIFLRWDKKTSIIEAPINPHGKVTTNEFDKKMIALCKEEAKKSKDWWRRIGVILMKDGKIIHKEHNVYVPSDQIANAEGDPRGNFKSGVHLESSLAFHAEASCVAWAAREGISLKGAEIYAETFPCPPCAKQLAYSGIIKLYYRTGYRVLDAERILKSQGVEIIFVK